MFALVDCNNFYASCERLFRPDLEHVPIVVLSNNDGCVIARSKEVKALNIKMAQPIFKLQSLIKQHGIVCFSSNYALYGDLSARVMDTIEQMACEVEVYSIDEAFLNLNGFEKNIPLVEFGLTLKSTIKKNVGLPVCVGIAKTKTLAKLANHAAKKWPATKGVVYLDSQTRVDKLLKLVDVSDVWGVGRRLSKKMKDIGIHSAFDLASTDPKHMSALFSVNIEKTVHELNGTSCLALDDVPSIKQQIICSRSFSERVLDYQSMKEAICTYTAKAIEKLRKENQCARVITVSIRTSALSKYDKQYSNAKTGTLQFASNDTRDFTDLAWLLLASIWRDGYRYAKAGVMVSDFYDEVVYQDDLFDKGTQKTRDPNLMKVLDVINQKGLGKITFAGEGVRKGWKMKQEYLSPAYTTRWSDIRVVG